VLWVESANGGQVSLGCLAYARRKRAKEEKEKGGAGVDGEKGKDTRKQRITTMAGQGKK
jgi:hypothetical protein